MEENNKPRKFKLRRIKVDEDIIKKNLEPLQENIKKKKRAQEAYYENNSGVSPLVRAGKQPVHQRLGRNLPYTLGTNTSAILPKRRLRVPGNQRTNRTMRIFTAQQRLNRIRARQRDMVVTQNGITPKRIKLRRTLPNRLGGPTNLTVEVKNNNAFIGARHSQNVRRFKQILNIQLQQEIRKIQMNFLGGRDVPPSRITPTSTAIPLHIRFAQLS